jgi:exosortase
MKPQRAKVTRAAASRIAALTAVVVAGSLLFAPTVNWLITTWRVHPYYSHGFLLVIVAAWLFWSGREALRPVRVPSPSDSALGVTIVAIAAAGTALALNTHLHAAAAMGLLAATLGVTIIVSGRSAGRAALFPLGLLALGIPLPLAERVGPGLAADIASLSAAAVGAVGVSVVRAGAELTVGDGAFTIGAPCSGLRSSVALVTLAYMAAGMLGGPLSRRAALVIIAIPLALFANFVRLVGLLVVTHARGADAGLAVFEGPASPILFAVATVALLALARPLGLHDSKTPADQPELARD